MDSTDVQKRIILRNIEKISNDKSYSQRKLATVKSKLDSGSLEYYEKEEKLALNKRQLEIEIDELEKSLNEWEAKLNRIY